MITITPLDKQSNDSPSIIKTIPFQTYISAAKQSGKSTLLLNMLTNPEIYCGVFNRIIYISDTAELDEKTQSLKSVKNILLPNLKLKKKLKCGFDIDNTDDEPPITQMQDDDFLTEPDMEFLHQVCSNQRKITIEYGKKYSDKILIVLDDIISDKRLNSREFSKICFNSRHLNISLIFIGQSYMSLPKRLRLNCTNLIIFEIFNRVELKLIYLECCSGSLTFESFLTLFHHCTESAYSFLQILMTNPKGYKYSRCFEKFINHTIT